MPTGRVFARAGAALRQWRYPREFRIRAAASPADALTGLARVVEEIQAAQAAQAVQAAQESGAAERDPVDDLLPGPPEGALPDRTVADVATSLWRLRARMERMDDPPRALVRHLEIAWDALAGAGIEIRDHAGEPFDPGLAMSVAAYQPTPGLTREQIIETIRPGVYLGHRSLQMAEVIVGTPESAGTGGGTAGATEGTRTR